MIISRRHVLMGAACLAAAGSAAALKPRHRLSLAGDTKLDRIIPKQFSGWVERPTDALIRPEEEDSLAVKIYSQIVGRLYVDPDGAMVMLLIAYGDTQNDLLQLHRPEVCYPAFGFKIERSVKTEIPLPGSTLIPGRALTAASNDRIEQILYWTRVGEHLPTDGREQRLAKLQDQMAGVIADGILVRISTVGENTAEGLKLNRRFSVDLMNAIPAADRAILVGTEAARRIASAPRMVSAG